MADTSYQPKVYRKQGGNEQVIASGGTLTLESGSTLAFESGVTISPSRVSGWVPSGGVSNTYGINIDGAETFFVGGAASKSRLVNIEAERPDTAPTSGDCYDDLLKLASTNYSVSPGYILRSFNAKTSNGNGGSMALIEHNVSVNNKSGGTCLTVRALAITAENYGTCATEFGGLYIVLKNEGAAATREYGMWVHNANNSVAGAVGAAYLATDTGANIGWNYGLDLYGATIQKAAFRDANQVCHLSGAGVPSDGTTGDEFAAIGSTYADITNGKIYVNGGTMASPVWKLVTSA